jgi:hypothetical protein
MGKLDRYVRIMEAIGWTLLIGFLVLLGVSATLPLFSLRRAIQGRIMTEVPQKYKERTKIVVFSPPVITKYSDYVMIPIGQRLISEKDTVDSLAKGGYFSSTYQSAYQSVYYGYSLYGGDYNNILFHRKDGSESYLLLNKKAAITDFYYPYQSRTEENRPRYKFLLFGIVEEDYNKDGFLTEKDAVIAYISTLSGRNLKPLTPSDAQFLRWDIDEDREVIYITYRKDTNNDGKFNILDQTYVIEVNALTGKVNSSIIDDKLIQKIKSLVF